MNEAELKALQLTQQAVMRLINEVVDKTVRQEGARELMTVSEVAELLRISRWRLYHVYPEIGLSPVRGLGRKLLFRRAEVMQLLERRPPRRGRPPNRVRLAALLPVESGQ